MTRILASIAAAVLTLSLFGCTAGESDSSQKQATDQPGSSLNLSVASTDAKVGSEAALNLGFSTDGSALFGAMIADDSQARLTQWHSDPADAVTFDDAQNMVTFKKVGQVTLWATWTDASGTELESNHVTLKVTAADVGTEQPR